MQPESEYDKKSCQENFSNEIKKLDGKSPQKLYYPIATFFDVLQEESIQNVQNRCSANTIYEWNIDGVSDYNIHKILQQMTIMSNVYKIKQGTSDQDSAQILIVGFTGQLKG